MQSTPRILWLDLSREHDNKLRRLIANNLENFCEITGTPIPDYVAQSPNTVIVCHVDFPTGPSLELLRRYRFACPYVPMITIVADRSNDLLQWFLQMRIWDVIFKPCLDAHLLHCLQEANHPDPLMKFALPRDVDLPVLVQGSRYAPPCHTSSEEDRRATILDRGSAARLTPSESRVFAMVCKGYNAKEIARLLNISYETVRKHQKSTYRKLGVNSALQAAVRAG